MRTNSQEDLYNESEEIFYFIFPEKIKMEDNKRRHNSILNQN